jgi:hypothetical protein
MIGKSSIDDERKILLTVRLINHDTLLGSTID